VIYEKIKNMLNITADYPYWIALAHLPHWRTERLNGLLLAILETHCLII